MGEADSAGVGKGARGLKRKPKVLSPGWIPILFVLSCAATFLIQSASRPDQVLPADGDLIRGCAAPVSMEDSVSRFVGEVGWQSKFLLESVIAGFAFMLVAFVVWRVLQEGWRTRRIVLAILIGMGVLLVIADIVTIQSMLGKGLCAEITARFREWFGFLPEHQGFLSRLLATLGGDCDSLRQTAIWGRLAGEPVGFAIGIAMYAATVLPEDGGTGDLAKRSRTLNHLLYAASLLFVAGLLMSSANFALILDRWKWDSYLLEGVSRDGIIERGVELAGVAYSAILAVFFLPTRLLLEARIGAAMDVRSADLEAQEKWRKENGFNGGWKEDVRQILAILAPVITAPLFKALIE